MIKVMEWNYIAIINEIDKGVTSVAFVLEVDGEIKEINFNGPHFLFTKFGEKHTLCIPNGGRTTSLRIHGR
jgi:hypothetical protein